MSKKANADLLSDELEAVREWESFAAMAEKIDRRVQLGDRVNAHPEVMQVMPLILHMLATREQRNQTYELRRLCDAVGELCDAVGSTNGASSADEIEREVHGVDAVEEVLTATEHALSVERRRSRDLQARIDTALELLSTHADAKAVTEALKPVVPENAFAGPVNVIVP